MNLLSPRVTLAAFYTSAASIVVAVAPAIGALAGLGNPLATLFGAAAASKIVAGASIVAAVAGVGGARVAAAGRSIVPEVDGPADPPSGPPPIPPSQQPVVPFHPAA